MRNPFTNTMSVKRGTILELRDAIVGNGHVRPAGTPYMLTRIMADVPAGRDAVTGAPLGPRYDHYNLVNMNTGKTRVSAQDRIMRVPAGVDPKLGDITRHFGIRLDDVCRIGDIAADINRAVDREAQKTAANTVLQALALLAQAGIGAPRFGWVC